MKEALCIAQIQTCWTLLDFWVLLPPPLFASAFVDDDAVERCSQSLLLPPPASDDDWMLPVPVAAVVLADRIGSSSSSFFCSISVGLNVVDAVPASLLLFMLLLVLERLLRFLRRAVATVGAPAAALDDPRLCWTRPEKSLLALPRTASQKGENNWST